MDCREYCGACCIAPSINGPVPGMPLGKPAGTPCVQLDEAFRCKIFGLPNRPACCGGLKPSEDMCGKNRTQALLILTDLERLTQP